MSSASRKRPAAALREAAIPAGALDRFGFVTPEIFADLERFIAAQEGVYAGALGELRGGRKTGHWIWFVFPQLVGLGRSEMSRRYGIVSLAESPMRPGLLSDLVRKLTAMPRFM